MSKHKGSSVICVSPDRSDASKLAHPVETLTFLISGSPVVIYLLSCSCIKPAGEKATFRLHFSRLLVSSIIAKARHQMALLNIAVVGSA